MTRFVAYLLGSGFAVLLVGSLSEQRLVQYESRESLLLFSLLLGALNAFVKPILSLLSLPITCLTVGLFALVLNGLLFAAAAAIVPGIDATLLGAFVGGIVVSVSSGLIYSVLDER